MKIVVIGELCYDYFVYGNCDRLSPEAPVPVFVPITETTNLGMAGNVRQNLWALNQSLQIGLYHQSKEIKKTRYVDQKTNHMFLRVDTGENKIDSLFLSDELIRDLKYSDATIVSDYDKGFLSDTMLHNISDYGKLKIIDTKKKLKTSIIERFDFIKLNENEYNNNEIPNHLIEKIIVTLGSKGAMYKNIIYPSPSPKETIDVSGAGDTFTASFTLKFLETNNVEESVIYANKISSVVVSKRGVVTP